MITTLAAALCLLASPALAKDRNDARFVFQSSLPETMKAGESATLVIIMKNSGGTKWSGAANYKLGTQNPQDNMLFTPGRVALIGTVNKGVQYNFNIPIKAPATPGDYELQFRMLREHVEWFGQLTPKIKVTVEGKPPVVTPPAPTPTPAPTTPKRTGKVRLDNRSLADDQGPFNAVGFTLMSGLRLYKFNKAQLETEFTKASAAGYDFMRMLSMVGAPSYWTGREIDPDMTIDKSWTDYDAQLAGYLDYAYSFGLRTEGTIFADAQVMMPSREARRRHVRRIIEIVKPRLQTIAYLEVANEPWQNGFDGTADELAEYGRMLKEALPGTVVALGAPQIGEEANFAKKGFPMSLHLDRDVSKNDGMWRPVRQPWEGSDWGPPWTNNEPIGPGSSVATDSDCTRQKALIMNTFVSKGFAYVFHTSAGVRSIPDRGFASGLVSDMPCFKDMPLAAKALPAGQPNYARQNGHWAGSPFTNRDEVIQGNNTNRRGVMRIYSGTSGGDLTTLLLHVPVGVKLECKVTAPVTIFKIEPLAVEDVVDCVPGKTFDLGPGARLLRRSLAK